jgi:hypothetical protein
MSYFVPIQTQSELFVPSNDDLSSGRLNSFRDNNDLYDRHLQEYQQDRYYQDRFHESNDYQGNNYYDKNEISIQSNNGSENIRYDNSNSYHFENPNTVATNQSTNPSSSPIVFPTGSPRSAAEATRNPDDSKFRQLPCRTFISVGTCPYRERCVYLHDPRCMVRDAKTKTRQKNKEDIVADSLFWPVMPVAEVQNRFDNRGQPHVIQNYNVPVPKNDQYCRHDQVNK